MKECFFVASLVSAMVVGTAVAQDPVQKTQAEREPTRATYLVTGLHCPPCTRTVESSLLQVKGVHAVKVDWKTKTARLEFDESILPAQAVAQRIAGTPHMMGGNMHYGGWLALRVPVLKDDATGKQVKEVLSKVKGVQQVAVYPAQRFVGIAFDAKDKLTSQQLVETLAKAGLKAENF